MYIIGIDIGGTKIAVSLGTIEPKIIDKVSFATINPVDTIELILNAIDDFRIQYDISGIGISCGGPLSSKDGIILSPPNLPLWDNIAICKIINEHTNIPTFLENDANACALAEFLWGAGKGSSNMAFLTFGTGLGAGFIFDGQLYRGKSDMAGEIGHIRLNKTGPIGYHKAGSFEGFCSGGGISRMAEIAIQDNPDNIDVQEFVKLLKDTPITTKLLGEYANKGDKFSINIFQESGYRLGQGIALLIDILNLDRIVIGSIFTRMEPFLRPSMEKVLKQECLTESYENCNIVPALLSENIGDYAALGIALHQLKGVYYE